jgi:DNA-binding transcriptional LysR family regulator
VGSISVATGIVPAVESPWPGLELRHLVAVVAVADAGTISRAAEQLGYTQSAVSQQIAALERLVGAPLFERPGGPKPLRLTDEGEALLLHARAVLALLRDAEADVRAVSSGDKGPLRVGTVQSAGTRILPGVLRRFAAERPGVEILLRESGDPEDLLEWLERGELDVTFCELPLAPGPFDATLVLEDPIVLLAPANSPETAMARVPVTHVAGLPLVGHRGAQCSAITMQCFEGLDVEPRFVFRSDDNTTLQGCVGAGLGYAIVPILTIDTGDPSTTVLSLDPEPSPRQLGLAWHAARRRPPALAAFVDTVVQVCEGLALRVPA